MKQPPSIDFTAELIRGLPPYPRVLSFVFRRVAKPLFDKAIVYLWKAIPAARN